MNEYAIRQRSFPSKKKSHAGESESKYFLLKSEYKID